MSVKPNASKTRKSAAESSHNAPSKTLKPLRAKAAATKAPATAIAKRAVKPAAVKPAAAKPTAAKPAAAKPVAADVAAKPVAAVAAKPVAAKPAAIKPAVVAKPAAAQAAQAVEAAGAKPVVAAPVVEAPPRSSKGVLAEGHAAPAFELPRDGGGMVSSHSFAGRKLVVFFYPRASTPGCTKEAIDFTRLADAFATAGIGVLGISADNLKAQDAFRDKYQLTTPLLSDETHQILEAYGVWGEKSMYGKIFQGILRTTVLIGKDGRVGKIWRNVKVDGHADEVLAAAIELE
ncbi:peroxiredoxin [Rhodopseudomonas palustris]|uniref:peroxiredoxin n=1 Tax=Rhodopseudomonas palustris TaxID=1076 RepID=UPI0009B59A0E